MHLVCVTLNSTIKWAGPCTGSYRCMKTPPELVVLCGNIVNNSTSQCQGPTVLWSVVQGKGCSPPGSEKPVCQGLTHQVLSYACCLPLKQGLVLSGLFLYFHFVQRSVAEAEIHPLFCNSGREISWAETCFVMPRLG